MPNIPYIYIPESDFAEFERIIKTKHNNVNCTDNFCMISKPCRGVVHAEIGFAIHLSVYNETDSSILLDLDAGQMLLPGNEVTGGTSKQCYFPIFKHGLSDTDQ